MMTPTDVVRLVRSFRRPKPKKTSCAEDGQHMVDAQHWRCIRCNEPIAVMSMAEA